MDPVSLADCLPGSAKEMVITIISESDETAQAHEQKAFADGYKAGWDAGYEAGFGRAHEEMAAAWRAAHAAVQKSAGLPTFAELQRLRYGSTNTHTREITHAA